MSRYKMQSIGLKGRVHIWDDIRTLDNTQKHILTFTSGDIIQSSGIEDDWLMGSSICVDSTYAVVGIPGGEKAIVYEYNGTTWVEVITLTAGSLHSIGSEFGYSVSVQDSRIIVGAPGYSDNMGAVYLFERKDGQWRESIPFQLLPNDSNVELSGRYGSSTAYHGNLLVVGAPYAYGGSTNTDRYGSVYSYTWGAHNRNLSILPKITPSIPQNNSLFGYSLSLNNENTLVIGAPYEDVSYGSTYTNNGAVYVFQRTTSQANIWTQKARIISPIGEENLRWGYSLSFRNNHLLIGSPGMDSIGSASLYYGFNDTYTYQYTFKSRTSSDLLDPTVSTGDNQGFSVSFNNELTNVMLGSPNNNSMGSIYSWSKTEAGNWLPSITSKLVPGDILSSDSFGHILSSSGDYIFVSSIGRDNNTGGFYIVKVT
jgi:hypothetical protein